MTPTTASSLQFGYGFIISIYSLNLLNILLEASLDWLVSAIVKSEVLVVIRWNKRIKPAKAESLTEQDIQLENQIEGLNKLIHDWNTAQEVHSPLLNIHLINLLNILLEASLDWLVSAIVKSEVLVVMLQVPSQT
jgi:predicted nucleic acid-binding protein